MAAPSTTYRPGVAEDLVRLLSITPRLGDDARIAAPPSTCAVVDRFPKSVLAEEVQRLAARLRGRTRAPPRSRWGRYVGARLPSSASDCSPRRFGRDGSPRRNRNATLVVVVLHDREEA